MHRKLAAGLVLWCVCLPIWSHSEILPFGFNKVNYREFDWKAIQSDHFEIYFYPEEEALARRVAVMAERAYQRVTTDLDVYPFERTPLFVYRNQPEFQQTQIIPGYIGEGVGGVTEAFKNRIVIPAVSSESRMEEVITHEFTHRVQFEVLYGGFLRSLKLLRSVFVPLWFAEGMAEYEAADQDPALTGTLLRDAVISDRLRPLDQLDSFNHLDRREVVLAYKMGQSVFGFIAKEFGKEKIGLLLKEYQKPQATIQQVLRTVLGIELEELSERWQKAMREQSWYEVYGRQEPSSYGRLLTPIQKKTLSWYSKPVMSPDGKHVAMFSDYENYSDLYLLDMETFHIKKLVGLQFEGIVSQGHGFSWSADGRMLAFSAIRGGVHALYFYDLEEQRVSASFQGGFEFLASPAFSPDRKSVAFVGVKNGISDIYLWRMGQDAAVPITADEHDDDAPAWSPDGTRLVYSSERGGFRHLILLTAAAVEGDRWRETVLADGPFDYQAPWWSLDGMSIYLHSSRDDGRFNLFEYRFADSSLAQLTRVKIGVLTPRPTPKNLGLLYVAYEGGSQKVYLMAEDRLRALREKPLATFPALNVPELKVDTVGETGAKGKSRFTLQDAKDLPIQPYRFSPSIDLVYFLFGYDSISGFVGGGYFVGSDLLGNHQFEVLLNAFREFTSGYQLTYLYMPWRVALGARIYNWQNFIPLRDPLGQDLGRTGSREAGGALLASYPFDRYRRIDLAVGSHLRGEEPGGITMANGVSVALVQEGRVFHLEEPISGMANNISVQRAERVLNGTERYTTVLTEHQWYTSFSRDVILATRIFFGSSTDNNAQEFLIGGVNSLRGYAFREFNGSHVALLNLELRFPVSPSLDLAFWPFNWLLIKRIRGALFIDNGAAWGEFSAATWDRVKVGIGGGLRIHTFVLQAAPLILRVDVGKRLDSSQSEVYYFGIGHAF